MNPSNEISEEQRTRLLYEVRALAGATLQKLWLPSAQLAVLQLRVPGRTALAVVDARLPLAALAPERPVAPESAPKSQATLRAALTGARFDGARLEVADDAPSRRAPTVRLSFTAEAGARALLAEQGAALLLLAPDGDGERIVWASGGAGASRRPGGRYPAVRVLPDVGSARGDLGASGGADSRGGVDASGGANGGDAPAREREPRAEASGPASTKARARSADEALVLGALAAEEAAALAARKGELLKQLRAKEKKIARTLAAVDEDLARAARGEEDLRRGSLLLPLQSRIPRGAREARVPDWSRLRDDGTPEELAVALDPALSAEENAARWLKRGQRYRAAAPRIAARKAEVERALASLRALLARAAAAADAVALRAAESEAGPARAGGRGAPKGPARDAAPRLPYRAFRSSSGARILVGRSARDNDALTRLARGNDLWLHARGVQGSHVIVADPGDAPDSRTLAEAALLAAWFSSARGEDHAEVSWTRRKHVRKPKGAAPGAVTFSQDRTVRIRRDDALVASLLAGEER